MKRQVLLIAFGAAIITNAAPVTRPPPAKVANSLDDCNVTWDSPSGDSFGSMPLGNGDVGANVWVEANGDLVLYLSKVDAFDAGHMLPKLGRVRLRLDPSLDTKEFQQTLVLRDAAIEVKAGDLQLRLWIDANQPILRVQGSSATPRKATLSFESLRPLQEDSQPLPGGGTVGILFHDTKDRLAWCYRNQSSAWADHFRAQNTPEMVAKTKDPILHRTAGGILSAPKFKRSAPDALVSEHPLTSFDASVRLLCNQPESPQAWLVEAERPLQSDWAAHRKYWQGVWNRSHIFVGRCGEGVVNLDQCLFTQFPQASKAYEGHKQIDAALNAFQLSQRYALERFCQAAASRGTVPPPYNGSIFTMDMPAGGLGFDAPKSQAVSPDGRDWAVLSFMWQNTRHPYWSMPARGDYDTLVPGMEFVRNGLEIGRDRCRKLLGIDGAFIMEASWWHNVGVFNWEGMPGHLRYHQLATVELPALMAETYEHTRDSRFLKDVLLPCADAGIEYYASRFTKRDARGRMLMQGVGCAETYQGVNNPCTEIGCLKYLLTKLLSFEIDDARRSKWGKLLAELPGIPTRRIRGLDLLAVGDAYDSGREICESPELYSIYPFRQVWIGKPELLANARQSFHVRNISLDGTDDKQAVETGGWQSAPVQSAYLGLAREAARLASINFNDQFIHWTDNVAPDAPFPLRPRARFPAFWECKMDGTPDNDHGANSVNTLQSMLLQSDGRKIFLLPAWPEDWDVSFKLTATFNTTVECVYQNGKVQSLKVTPESRRADILDLSTPEQRIRTLVDIACADRNYLFGLPPMLDGQPKPGPTTGPWLEKYGESVTNVKGAPWPNCVFRDKVLYVHGGGSEAPLIPALVVSSKRLSDTILKVEYDQSLEPIALATSSAGSLSAARTGAMLDLGKPVIFDRLEFTIENPGHRRGQSQPFELQIQQADGQWRTVHQGRVFGAIYSKRFHPVSAQNVRLNLSGVTVQRFDLFPPGA
jgi:alpha-L-fucosidase 2